VAIYAPTVVERNGRSPKMAKITGPHDPARVVVLFRHVVNSPELYDVPVVELFNGGRARQQEPDRLVSECQDLVYARVVSSQVAHLVEFGDRSNR